MFCDREKRLHKFPKIPKTKKIKTFKSIAKKGNQFTDVGNYETI